MLASTVLAQLFKDVFINLIDVSCNVLTLIKSFIDASNFVSNPKSVFSSNAVILSIRVSIVSIFPSVSTSIKSNILNIDASAFYA